MCIRVRHTLTSEESFIENPRNQHFGFLGPIFNLGTGTELKIIMENLVYGIIGVSLYYTLLLVGGVKPEPSLLFYIAIYFLDHFSTAMSFLLSFPPPPPPHFPSFDEHYSCLLNPIFLDTGLWGCYSWHMLIT